MNKKTILIILIIAIAVIAVGVIYFTYIADHTYQDERMSITVPQGTQFNITATDAGGDFSSVIYRDSSKKNITIKMIKVPETSLFGVSMKDYVLKLENNDIKNQSYVSVKVTDNYTIYYSNKTGRYGAIIRNPGFNGYVTIGCNGNLDDITNLVESFKFKSYTTEGLTIQQVNNTDTTNNTSNTTIVNNTTTTTSKNSNQKSSSKLTYLKEGEAAPYHEGWGPGDYYAHGYRFSNPNGVG